MRKLFASGCVSAFLFAAAAPSASAAYLMPDDLVRLAPPDLVKPDFNRFGDNIAAEGHTVIIAAPTDSSPKGAAYIFERRSSAQWDMTTKLVSPEGAGSGFGSKVDLSGNTALIKEGPTLHIFVRQGSSWVRQARLELGGQPDVDGAIDGDRLFIVSHRTGIAYAYRRANGKWTRQQQIIRDTHQPMFYSVAMGDGVAVVGATPDISSIGGRGNGSVNVYRLHAVAGQPDEWVKEARLSPPQGVGDTGTFGLALDVSHNRVAVGMRREADFRGAVYVFARGSDSVWRQTAKLTPKDTRRHCFGDHVSIYYDRISTSAPCITDGQPQSGVRSVHVFQRKAGTESWALHDRLFPGEGVPVGTAVSDCGVFMGVPNGGSNPDNADVTYVMPSAVCAAPISR